MLSNFKFIFQSYTSKYAIRSFSLEQKDSLHKPLTIDNLNANVKNVEYAVRGPIPSRALEIEEELNFNPNSHPFDKLIHVNIGDPQNLGQPPLTFPRQLLALCAYPSLLSGEGSQIFPDDVKSRARQVLKDLGSFGGYSHSIGYPHVRKSVSDFISKRDNISSDSTIILSDGASKIIQVLLSCLGNYGGSFPNGVMIPIPQYPLYSASLSYLGLKSIPYFLQEDSLWGFDIDKLTESLRSCQDECRPRALVVINPGNPTGQCLDSYQQKEIIRFCHNNNLLLLADEVYQDNIYDKRVNWTSFRKIYLENQAEFHGHQLASFHSLSKGFMGECGFRGGYGELIGFDEPTLYHITKLLSSMLCPNIVGQILLESYVNPPRPGDDSFNLYSMEKHEILNSLQRRATKLYHCFKNIKNISINPVQGAMYAFPRVFLPQGAVKCSLKHSDPILRSPDVFYCMKLLEETGIVVVPGSGFGQEEGTWHFRITILPQEDVFEEFLAKFKEFHINFIQYYS